MTGAAPHLAETMRAMGEIVFLLSHSPLHAEATLAEIDALFFAPLRRDQLRLWRRGERPVALATWALLDAASAERHARSGAPLAEAEWRCGDQLWFIDVVAPFGDARAVSAELRRLIPPGREGRGARRGADGALRRVARYLPYPAAKP